MDQTAIVPTLENASDAPVDGQDEVSLALIPSEYKGGKNWADDDDVNAFFMQHVYPVMIQTRSDMITLHEEWKQIARMTTLSHDSNQRYIGRSNVYVPGYAKARSTVGAAIIQALFPSDEYCSVTSAERPDSAGDTNALAVKTYLQWEFEKNAAVRTKMAQGVGERIDYGHFVVKFWYDDEEPKKRKSKRLTFDPLKKMTKEVYSQYRKKSGLRVSVRSVFDWYVYPMNIGDLSEATLIFEDIDLSIGAIRKKERAGTWKNTEFAINAPEIPEHTDSTLARQMEQAGTANDSQQFGDSDIGGIRVVSEVYCEMILPRAEYDVEGGEDPTEPLPVRLTVCGDKILQCIRVPEWEQCHPYLVDRDDPKPGNFFSKGTGKLISGIQYILNDFTNQMNDNGNMAMNPMVIRNPSLFAGPLTPFKPGGVWDVNDIDGAVKFDRPPIEQIQYGMSLIKLYSDMLENYSGAPQVLQGTKAASTATSSQIIARGAMNPIKNVVESIENNIMNPLMYYTWLMGQQYREGTFMIEVMGDVGMWNPKSFSKHQLCGDFIFRWLASSQAANAAQRAEQAIKILQVMSPPVIQTLMQQGWVVDFQPLIKRLYQDALGYRDFDKFVKRMDEMQQMMMGAGAGPAGSPQPPGAPGAGPDNSIRSAASQSPVADGSQGQMVEGEGDVLTGLRAAIEAETGNLNQ